MKIEKILFVSRVMALLETTEAIKEAEKTLKEIEKLPDNEKKSWNY